eukprot:s2760_g14.t1
MFCDCANNFSLPALAMNSFRRCALQTLALALVCGCVAIWSTTADMRVSNSNGISSDVVAAPKDEAGITNITGVATKSLRQGSSGSGRLSFLFWLVDLAATPGNLFALDLAAELAALGHLVIVESATGGELREPRGQSVYREHRQGETKFRVKTNPALAEMLDRDDKASEVWKIASASLNGNDPHIILCFSTLWENVGLRMPHNGLRPSRSRLVWYFYLPLDCKVEKESIQRQNDVRQTRLAMTKFDAVLFTTDAAREEWANDNGKYFTFRPFLRTVEASSRFSSQVAKDRDEIRSAHRISLEGFIVTIVDNPWCRRDGQVGQVGHVDLSSPKLAEIMSARFGRDWLIVSYDDQSMPVMQLKSTLSTNILRIADWKELLRYVAVADLHVSLSLPDFAFEVIHARSFAVPVLTIPSELAFQNNHDCFILKTVKQATLEGKLSKIINKPTGVLYQVGEAGRQAVFPGFVGSAVTTRVSHLVDRLNHMLLSSRGISKKRVAIFVQLLNPTDFPFLWPCIQNVIEAHSRSSVDVIMTTPQPVSTLQAAVAQIRSRRGAFYVVASQAEDRGADAGIFIQQLLLARELSISPTIIFKARWNSHRDWGSLTMQTMCGSVSAVRRTIGSLTADAMSGMIGPAKLTWNLKSQEGHEALNYFGRSEKIQLGMMSSWSLMSTSDFPAEKHLWIVTGGCYWVRMDIPWWEDFIFPVAARLLVSMGPHDASCVAAACQIAPAMQWLIPSFISKHGNKVASRNIK